MIDTTDGPAMITGTISFEDFRAAQQAHTRVARRQVRSLFLVSGVAGLVLLAVE